MAGVVLLLLVVLAIIGVPIAIALGIATIIGALSAGVPFFSLPQSYVGTLTNFPIVAIPLFVLAGKFMEASGISASLIAFAKTLVGHLRGGIGYVSILALGFFGAISGSATAATVAIGALLIPAMVAQGYSRPFAASLQGVGGIISGIIPPSIALVIYGVVAEVSIGDLFIAGVVPGVMIIIGLGVALWIALRMGPKYNPAPNLKLVPRATLKGVGLSFVTAVPSLFMPVLILGGIYTGFFTPTEAGAVACLYAFVLWAVLFRSMTWSKLCEVFVSSIGLSSLLLFIMAIAGYFSSWLTVERVPQMLVEALRALELPMLVTLLILVITLLIIGMFMEGLAALVIVTPIMLPIALDMGIDPVQFGLFLILMLCVGLVTPPVGIQLFTAAKVGGTSVSSVIKPSLYFASVLLVVGMLVFFFPGLTLFLLGR